MREPNVEDDDRVIWWPDPNRDTALARFAAQLPLASAPGPVAYPDLHAWSVRDLAGFWSAVADFHQVRFHQPPTAVLGRSDLPGAQWFPGATLNYAEHALRAGPGRGDHDVAVIEAREDGHQDQLTWGRLREQVRRAQVALRSLGVQPGDRVVALAPNAASTLVAFLATASLGAVWACCSPDFGVRAVQDRFEQLAPTVLLVVDGYTYGGRRIDVLERARALRAALPTLRATVLIAHADPGADPSLLDPRVLGPDVSRWDQLLAAADESTALTFHPVPFEHPLWVLYSSGSTGPPKGIVHGHGGIVLEHLKSLHLQMDLGPGSVFCWYTTTGWMMWNLLVSGLLVGATVLLYDGHPMHPDPLTLWRLAAQHRVDYLGVSAPFVHTAMKEQLHPADVCDLSALRALGSTGSPLSPEGFDWVQSAVGPQVQICSVSGGTDLCTAFLGAAPTVPVRRGQLSVAALGADVRALDPIGADLVDEVGELVLTLPMPSMPVAFWNDPDGSRLRAAYYEDYPGRWRHGDWVRRTRHGSYVIHGRSDATLNRGGVRMGTAEFYAVVEADPDVLDSLVVDTTDVTSAGQLVCFLVLRAGSDPTQLVPRLRAALRAQLSPRHVPDRFVAVAAVPRTLSGKKCEVPVRRILTGADPATAVSRDALADPAALDALVAAAHDPRRDL